MYDIILGVVVTTVIWLTWEGLREQRQYDGDIAYALGAYALAAALAIVGVIMALARP